MSHRPFLVALAIAAGIQAQSITPVVSLGRETPHGVVSRVAAVAVDDRGSWVVYARAGLDHAIVRDGKLVLRGGQRLSQGTDVPEAHFVTNFLYADTFGDERIVSASGATVPGPAPTSFRSGVFLDTTPLVHTLSDPGPPFSAGAAYCAGEFRDVRANRVGQVLSLACVDDPDLGSGDSLQVFDVAGGSVVGLRTVAYGDGIVPFPLDLNDSGHVLHARGGLFPDQVLLDDVVIAQVDGAAPLPQGSWFSLLGGDLNDHGEFVLDGGIQDAADAYWAVATADRVVAKRGDSVPAIAPRRSTSSGTTASVSCRASSAPTRASRTPAR